MRAALARATAVTAALLVAATAAATTLSVTNNSDTGVGSLRQRIQIAAAGDTIDFAPIGTGTETIGLNSELAIGRDLTIEGPGAQLLSIWGGVTHRVFNVLAGNVTLSGLHVMNSYSVGPVGAPGAAGGAGRGGGILNAAALTLKDVLFENCWAIGGNGTGNQSFAGPGGPGEGGAIYNTGTLALVNCTLQSCHSAGGAGVSATGPLPGRPVGGLGRGGAILNAGTASLTNCTLASNEAKGGQCSTAGPGGDARGGAIFNASSIALVHCTIVSNTATGGFSSAANGDGQGGGINGGGSLRSTIVALNSVVQGVPVGPDALGTFASQGYNLIGKVDGSGGWVATDQTGTVATPLDPNLGTLGLTSGGPTPTRRPLAGSAALDRGGSGGPATDQTGHARVYDDPGKPNTSGGDGSDIGAVEVQPPVRLMVTQLGDPGPGSLRRAVETAAPGDSVGFQPGLTGTITLTDGTLYISRSLVLAGPGADVITVSGNGAHTVLWVSASSTISGLRFTGAAVTSPTPYEGCVLVSSQQPQTITGCAIVGNATTGLVVRVPLTLRNSTIAGNSATATAVSSAGGIEADNTLTLENCTISGNSGRTAGGIWQVGPVACSILHCTISGNHQTASVSGAGGVYNTDADFRPTVGGTVIAGNTSSLPTRTDISGSFTSLGFNLIGVNTGSGFSGTGDQVGTTVSPLDPMLGPLADNGGPTTTMSPLTGSPLIDHATSFLLATDQRGAIRPFDSPDVINVGGGDGSDVGAVEKQSASTAVEPGTLARTSGIVGAAPSPFRRDVTLSFTLNEPGAVDLEVYSADGRRVRSIARGRYEAGIHRVAWDGRDERGLETPSGIYFARLGAPQGTSTRTLVRIR